MFGLVARVANCTVVKKLHDSISHYLDLRVAREEQEFREVEAEHRRLHRLNSRFVSGEISAEEYLGTGILQEMNDIDDVYNGYLASAHSDRLKRSHRYQENAAS